MINFKRVFSGNGSSYTLLHMPHRDAGCMYRLITVYMLISKRQPVEISGIINKSGSY